MEMAKSINDLLKYNSVKAYYNKFYYISRSDATKERNFYVIERFCRFANKDPDTLVQECKKLGKEHTNKLLTDFLIKLSDERASPNTQKTYLSVIETFLKVNSVEFDEVNKPRARVMMMDRAPTSEEVRNAIRHADLEGKALMSFLAVTGCRVGEALQIRKEDLDLEKRRVRIRPEIAKDRVGRYVFLTPTAVAYIKAYLETRKDNDDKVFPLYKEKVWRIVHEAFTSTTDVQKVDGRYDLHTHSLRKFFYSKALLRLGKEKTEAIMGHKGYLDSSYLRLSIDEVQKEYEKLVPDLEEAIKV